MQRLQQAHTFIIKAIEYLKQSITPIKGAMVLHRGHRGLDSRLRVNDEEDENDDGKKGRCCVCCLALKPY